MLFTIPGYVFAFEGQLPGALTEFFETRTHNGSWYGFLCYIPWLLWQLPLLPVWFLNFLGAGVKGAAIFTTVFFGGIELAIVMAAIYSVKGDRQEAKKKRAAGARLREAKKAYGKNGAAYYRSFEKNARREHAEYVRNLEAKRKELLAMNEENANMRTWNKRFEEFTHSEEYRAAQADPAGEEKEALALAWQKAWYEAFCREAKGGETDEVDEG